MFDAIIDIIQEFIEGTSEYNDNIEEIGEALLEVISEAGIDINQLPRENLDQLIMEVFSERNEQTTEVSSSLSFKGFHSTYPLADMQCGPTCGFEAIENFIQLNDPGYTNSLSDYLQHKELFDGGSQLVEGGLSLLPQHYQHILSDFGIETNWQTFNHEALVDILSKNRGVLAVGDAHYLDAISYPHKNSYHAFMIIDVVQDEFGKVVGYKGLDSNFANQEVEWSPQEIESALEHSPLEKKLLVSNKDLNWPYKTS